MICGIIFIIGLNFIASSLAVDDTSSPVPSSDCPLIDDVQHAVMLPYPQDCSKYFSCWKGMAYLQQCPNNLHWSSVTYRCDYPDKAKCETSNLKLPTNITNPVLAASFTSEILYQSHPQDCSKYFKCQVLVCPSNYYWNSHTEKCDFPHNAQCPFLKNENDLEKLNSLSTLMQNYLPIQPDQPPANSFALQYPNDCGKFYECQMMLCPANYHWNSYAKQCDLPQAANCSLQSPHVIEKLETSTFAIPTAYTPPPTTSIATTPQINGTGYAEQTCDGYLHHYLPHPYDCHKFIQCNGWSFIHTCPDNLFWNAKLNTCDRVCVKN